MSEKNEIFENELIPGIILIKELKKPEKLSEIIGIIIYKIKLTIFTILNIEVDFSSSKNIMLKNNNNNYKKIKVNVMPFETQVIAEILLENDFKINPKFNFNLIIPEKNIQIKYLEQYEKEQNNLYQKFIQRFNRYPFEYVDLNEINNLLSNNNINFFDIDFNHNDEALVNNNNNNIYEFNHIIHWRRPQDFINTGNNKMGNGLKIFNRNDSPMINDVKQGLLPTNNLDCVLNALTEKNNLINRLIKNKCINKNGIYKIKLCIKGEWVTVIIDDYFPCLPFSSPIVSSTKSNDLWVLLIQKALAKSFGSYNNLINISILQYLNILTGCPTISYKISDFITNKNDIQTFINLINLYLKEKKYLIIAISNDSNNYLTISGIGYTVLDLIKKNDNYFIVSRINFFDKKTEKNYENYIKKLNKKYSSIFDQYYDNDKNSILLLTIEDFFKEFKNIIVCFTEKWEDVRIRGKFVDIGNEDSNNNLIVSKCFYNINLESETNLIINLYQDDDEFIFNKNNSRKTTLDISLAILKQDNESNEISLIKSLDFITSPYIQTEINLLPGNYIIFPRTSGCLFGKPKYNYNYNSSQNIIYDINNKKFSDIFICTIKDIFKKFDILLNRYLGYKEFKGFWECIHNDKTINEKYFNNNILDKYQSYLNGITEKGFIEFFEDIYLSRNGKEEINQWLNKLGYDNDLYPLKSRCFMITFQSEKPIKVSVYNTLETYLHSKIERLILVSNGKKIKQNNIIIVLQNKSMNSNVVTIGAINQGDRPYVVILSINRRMGLNFSDKRNKIEKLIEPGKGEFYFYLYLDNNSKNENIDINLNNVLDIDYYSVE